MEILENISLLYKGFEMKVIAGGVSFKKSTAIESIKATFNKYRFSVPTQIEIKEQQNLCLGVSRTSNLPEIFCCGDDFIVWEGTIHNEQELRKEFSLPSSSTGEFIYHLFLKLGKSFFTKLHGIVLVVLWQKSSDSFFIFRDEIGCIPFFFVKNDHFFVFSTNTAFIRNLVKDCQPCREAIIQYLVFNYPFSSHTFYRQIKQMPPNTLLSCSVTGKLEQKQNSKIKHQQQDYDNILTKEVCQYLTKDQLAFHLSGGIDSSLLCHIANQYSNTYLKVVTAYYDKHHADLDYSRKVASELEADIQEIFIEKSDVQKQFELIVGAIDSPIMAIGIITFWFMACCPNLSDVKAVISGIGGDHSFTGYKKLGMCSQLDMDSIFLTCAHVKDDTLSKFTTNEFSSLKSNLQQNFNAVFSYEGSWVDAIERFYALNFLQEHLRLTYDVHAYWGMEVYSPFLNPSIMQQGIIETKKSQNKINQKHFLRLLLQKFSSVAAQRSKKEQMSLPLRSFVKIFHNSILAEFQNKDFQLPGINYNKLCTFVSHLPKTSISEERFIWALYNIHIWLKKINVSTKNIWN